MIKEKDIVELITFTVKAHDKNAKKESKRCRLWDESTPYSIHSIWCATALLHETNLSEQTRAICYKALLLHDILEDTTADLPMNIEPEVRNLVDEVTFECTEDSIQEIWGKSDEAKLITLYDMASNLLDGSWMTEDQKNFYLNHTEKLAKYIEKHFGTLNIIKIIRSF